jgi:aldose 1-epimerase
MKLQSGDLTLELDPAVGGSITAFRWRDVDLMRPAPADPKGDALNTSCFALVPYSNRIRDGRFSFRGVDVQLQPNLPPQKHPLHGQAWRSAWQVESAGPDEAVLTFDYQPGEWPWAYQARQTAKLDSRGLDLTVAVTNRSNGPMPAGLGFHPYFPADDETILSTLVTGVWTVDEEVMPVDHIAPTGKYELAERRINKADLDNGYDGWSGEATITWPNKGVALRIVSPGVRYFQVYSPPEGGLFCAEPVTHANAAPNAPESEWASLGLKVLEPGETLELKARFEVAA